MKPKSWIPTLYLAESLPLVAVTIVSVVMYQEMGMKDSQITFYTGWLAFPWVIKPFWSPFIDSLKTKRWWIWTMEMLIGASLACVAFTIPTSVWFQTSIAFFMLIAFSSATHDISADGFYILALTDKEQELFVGFRNTFYRIGMVIGQGGLVMLAGKLQDGFGNFNKVSMSFSWSIIYMLLAVFMIALCIYHKYSLPQKEQLEAEDFNIHVLIKEVLRTLSVFFHKPYILTALFFICLFRLPEGLLTKIVPLFLKRTIEEGGLGLTDVHYGFIYGTMGVIGLLGGGILGGILVSHYGLRKCLWPLVFCITIPDAIYVLLSLFQPDNLWIIGIGVFVEQVGYGLGFTAYTLFLVSFSRGEHSTSVFSICTAFQYLGGVMLPGIVSGVISDKVGYVQFFCFVMVCCLVTFAVTAMVHIPETKKSPENL